MYATAHTGYFYQFILTTSLFEFGCLFLALTVESVLQSTCCSLPSSKMARKSKIAVDSYIQLKVRKGKPLQTKTVLPVNEQLNNCATEQALQTQFNLIAKR